MLYHHAVFVTLTELPRANKRAYLLATSSVCTSGDGERSGVDASLQESRQFTEGLCSSVVLGI